MVPFSKWLRRVATARHAATYRRRFCQPKVENLEERCLLSVFRPAVASFVDDIAQGPLELFAFNTGQDGHLYDVYYYPNQGWQWQDQGTPPGGATLASDPAVGNYYDEFSIEGLVAFVTGSDGRIYEDSYFPEQGSWTWTNLGSPPSGAAIAGTPAVGNYTDETGRLGLFVFATGSDGHLYDVYYFPGQGGWLWQDQGTPPSRATLTNAPAVGNYTDPLGRPGLFAFATGSDGHLYDVYYFPNQGGWLWQDQGTPGGGASLASDPAVGNYTDETGRPGIFAFATGSDGALYDVYFFPNQGGWQWQSQGRPPSGATVASDPAVGGYLDERSRRGLFAFATGSDGVLYDVYYFPNQGGWLWQSQGSPPSGASIISDPAVGNYIDETGRRGLFAFTRAADDHLYDVYYFLNQGGWLWQDQGMPAPGFNPQSSSPGDQHARLESSPEGQSANIALAGAPLLPRFADPPAWGLEAYSQSPGDNAPFLTLNDPTEGKHDPWVLPDPLA